MRRAGILDRASPLPLWAQLLADLRVRLAEGAFADHFPGELELVAEYGVSRNTVREAVRRLREEGTVVAERGRRPRVNPEIRQPLGAPYSLYESIEATGLGQRTVVRAREVVTDAEVATHLGVPDDEPLFHLRRLRLAGEEPLALDWIWLPLELAAPLLEADLTRRAFYEELAERTGIRLTGGQEHLRAVVPSAAERAELELPRSSAAFEIERLGRSGERTVEWRRTLIRGDRFSVIAELSRPPGGLLAAGSLGGLGETG